MNQSHISLFTGAGGLDIGLEQAGFVTRACVEIEKSASKTLEANRSRFAYPERPIFFDITKTKPWEILEESGLAPGETALVSGGPPCQPYSTAGKRGAMLDPRGSLIFNFTNFVEFAKPAYFVMENVKGLLSAAIEHRPLNQRGVDHAPLSQYERLGSLLTDVILPEFDRIGYDVVFGLVNSLDYGVPQARVRLIFIGQRREDRVGQPFSQTTGIKDLIRPTHNQDGTDGLEPWRTLEHPTSGIKGLRQKLEVLAYSPKRAEIFQKIPAGQNWRYLRDTYGAAEARNALGGAYDSTGGRVGFYRRLSYKKWAPTLPTSPIQKGTGLCHPNSIRPLSVAEYARIQGFPDDWVFEGSKASKYKQIGNAVPVGLGEAIGCAVKDLLREGVQEFVPQQVAVGAG